MVKVGRSRSCPRLCWNEERLLPIFSTLRSVVDRYLIIDSGSTDGSLGCSQITGMSARRSRSPIRSCRGDEHYNQSGAGAVSGWVFIVNIDRHLITPVMSYCGPARVRASRDQGGRGRGQHISDDFPTKARSEKTSVTGEGIHRATGISIPIESRNQLQGGRHSASPTNAPSLPRGGGRLLHFKLSGQSTGRRHAALAGRFQRRSRGRVGLSYTGTQDRTLKSSTLRAPRCACCKTVRRKYRRVRLRPVSSE